MKPSKRGRPKKVVANIATSDNVDPTALVPVSIEAVNEAPRVDEFVITVTIEQQTYTGTGVTALEALKAIPVPQVISTGLVVITHGDKRKEMLYPTMQLKRIFNIYHQEVLINDLVFGMS